MKTTVNVSFENRRVRMDGHSYTRCRFERCELVFAGVEAFHFVENTLSDCRFAFEGPARRVLSVFAAVVEVMPPERRDQFVREALDAHRPSSAARRQDTSSDRA